MDCDSITRGFEPRRSPIKNFKTTKLRKTCSRPLASRRRPKAGAAEGCSFDPAFVPATHGPRYACPCPACLPAYVLRTCLALPCLPAGLPAYVLRTCPACLLRWPAGQGTARHGHGQEASEGRLTGTEQLTYLLFYYFYNQLKKICKSI
uniref:pyruvate phosphate dikinase PEP/pyruvate-binding protein n=1 Tax=Coelastrella saipanensis TaxID=152631 RepID=UPI0010C29EF2|nr:hypothetical protein [Coelastrella saipanensis]YP_009629515.1 pyruvate phosphate dikinase PEP/pyruvate-binding protein [Coelastrella saipanensis]AVV61584.1 hypothetical protein [Coelastrella saipanensis]AVV61625.1 pyruvate phosphate dikinase PEP/pyruvate-binding protein [Coelastrella saipanensis]